jgi:O-antigen/teichoic acid export membrane protein
MPYLTKDPSIFGIYSVCVSVTIFLSYADLGFMRAGQKYAAESFIRSEHADEMKHIGFVAFVLLIFTLLCVSAFFYLGFNPQALIKGLNDPEKISTASSLLFILAIFSPVTVLQRMVSMIFDIRLEGYINQRMSLLASVITVSYIFYFFGNGRYLIVPYFLFLQSINLIFAIISLWLAKNKYNYNIKQLFRSIKFDTLIYKKANGLAYSGLYTIIVWILFYELDQIAIAKFIGVEKVAIYAIAFAFATLFRTLYGILFFPFTVRANYFVGNGDDEGLKNFCLQLVSLSAPLVILPTVAFSLIAKQFIMTWVGAQYLDSINLAIFFSLIFTFSFITYPIGMVLIAKERMKEMYIIATMQPIIYWGGILCTYSFWGLLSFAAFKFIATFVTQVYYYYILITFLSITSKEFFQKIIYPVIIPLTFLVIALLFTRNYMPVEKSKINLFIVLGSTSVLIVISFAIQYLISSNIRAVVKNLVGSILSKK